MMHQKTLIVGLVNREGDRYIGAQASKVLHPVREPLSGSFFFSGKQLKLEGSSRKPNIPFSFLWIIQCHRTPIHLIHLYSVTWHKPITIWTLNIYPFSFLHLFTRLDMSEKHCWGGGRREKVRRKNDIQDLIFNVTMHMEKKK